MRRQPNSRGRFDHGHAAIAALFVGCANVVSDFEPQEAAGRRQDRRMVTGDAKGEEPECGWFLIGGLDDTVRTFAVYDDGGGETREIAR